MYVLSTRWGLEPRGFKGWLRVSYPCTQAQQLWILTYAHTAIKWASLYSHNDCVVAASQGITLSNERGCRDEDLQREDNGGRMTGIQSMTGTQRQRGDRGREWAFMWTEDLKKEKYANWIRWKENNSKHRKDASGWSQREQQSACWTARKRDRRKRTSE